MAVDGPASSSDEEGDATMRPAAAVPAAGDCSEADVRACLGQLAALLREGYRCHALQRQPHLVLLDPRWYATRLRPAVAAWAALWLRRECPRLGAVLAADPLARYLTAPLDALQALRARVEGSLLPAQVKLLNLARAWVLTLLPHVLGKIHRVGFGVLRPGDLRMVDPKSPPSRRLLAVPFVGKDVPSRASEFAHPDVLIGLTVRDLRRRRVRRAGFAAKQGASCVRLSRGFVSSFSPLLPVPSFPLPTFLFCTSGMAFQWSLAPRSRCWRTATTASASRTCSASRPSSSKT
jgi:hypothetical protein